MVDDLDGSQAEGPQRVRVRIREGCALAEIGLAFGRFGCAYFDLLRTRVLHRSMTTTSKINITKCAKSQNGLPLTGHVVSSVW